MVCCNKYKDYTAGDWDRVLFSDETQVKQFSPHLVRIRRPPGQRYNSRYTTPEVKCSPSLMVWGCISSEGLGGLWFMPPGTTINAAVYLQLLKSKLREWLTIRRCRTFQHDGAPCHQAKLVQNWLAAEGVEVLGPWPGSSPDLNPIESCWALVKERVSRRNPTSAADLKQQLLQVWTEEITPEYCQKLCRFMPNRIQAVLAAKGGHTKY